MFLIAGGPGLLRAGRDEQARRLSGRACSTACSPACSSPATVVDGYAVKVMLLSPILVDYMGNRARAGAGARGAAQTRRAGAAVAAQWRFALLVAAVSPVAYVLVLFAMQARPCPMWRRRARSPCCSRPAGRPSAGRGRPRRALAGRC